MLEKVVYLQLVSHVTPVMSDFQHGFVSKRSCATNLASLLNTAWDSISLGFQTDCIYTDYTAAFQSVNHSLLIYKLEKSHNISGKVLKWFASYLKDRQQRVIVGGKCSEWCQVTSGTPEGGLLSPLLFAICIYQ